MLVALSIPAWPTDAAAHDLPALLLEVAPRAALAPEERLAWLDARSLDPQQLAARAWESLHAHQITVAGMAAAQVPIVAAILARQATDDQCVVIAPHGERAALAALPISTLGMSDTTHHLLYSVGITRIGHLAALSRESVEVRFGREGLSCWRHARADDPRSIFSARPREYPSASLDWPEFSTADREQLVFVLHSLLRTVCDQLVTQGMGARALELMLTLENRVMLTHRVGAARSTSQRTTWLRLMRRTLEKIELPDQVTGIAVTVATAGTPTVQQGDLFDAGFASAHAAESAVSHILDLQPDAVVVRELSAHPLPERRVTWHAEPQFSVSSQRARGIHTPTLQPQLLPTPREITMLASSGRGGAEPIRYIDNGTPHRLTTTLTPYHRSGEQWREGFSREYHEGVRSDGTIVLLFRNLLTEQWYLAGWWD